MVLAQKDAISIKMPSGQVYYVNESSRNFTLDKIVSYKKRTLEAEAFGCLPMSIDQLFKIDLDTYCGS